MDADQASIIEDFKNPLRVIASRPVGNLDWALNAPDGGPESLCFYLRVKELPAADAEVTMRLKWQGRHALNPLKMGRKFRSREVTVVFAPLIIKVGDLWFHAFLNHHAPFGSPLAALEQQAAIRLFFWADDSKEASLRWLPNQPGLAATATEALEAAEELPVWNYVDFNDAVEAWCKEYGDDPKNWPLDSDA